MRKSKFGFSFIPATRHRAESVLCVESRSGNSSALSSRIHLADARVDAPRLMAACDAIVHLPATPEAGGRALVQAQLARRPLIASNSGDASDFVEDGVTALLVPPGDATRLAAAIRELRDNPVRSDELAYAGVSYARRQFSPDLMIASLGRMLAETAGG